MPNEPVSDLPPSSAAAVAALPTRRVPKAVYFSVLLGFVGMLAIAVGTVRAVEEKLEYDRQLARTRDEATILAISEAINRGVSQGIVDAQNSVMTPPTNDKLFTILSKGVTFPNAEYRTTTVGTTPAAMFATDLTVAQQTDAYTQLILVQDTHATQNLCVRPIAWPVAPTTCTAACAASGITCSGAATDGWRLQSGQAIPLRWDGTNCACVVGSGAGTNYQSLRSLR